MFKKLLAVSLLLFISNTPLSIAETLGSSTYQIENPSLDVGGETSSSTNYTSRESIGDSNDASASSTNYKVFPGFVQHAYPGVPATPTFTNTGGTLYNALDFVVAKALCVERLVPGERGHGRGEGAFLLLQFLHVLAAGGGGHVVFLNAGRLAAAPRVFPGRRPGSP